MEKPLVDKEYLLEKFPGKGGWIYAQIPEILQNKHAHFGWVRDLTPMGNGKLFLPVKAEIRKRIRKQAGDYVRVTLYPDNLPVEIPEELKLCLEDEPKALEVFMACTKGEQKAFIAWIYSAKTEDTKVERIARTINKLAKGVKFYD